MSHQTHLLGIVAAAALIASLGVPAQAQRCNCDDNRFLQLPDRDADYPFRSRDISVEQALQIFSDNLRIGLSISEEIEGTLNESTQTGMTRKEYIDALAIEFDFIWYFDGNVLRVSPVGDFSTQIIPLRDNEGETVIEILRSLDIYQAKFTHRADNRSRTFLVAGPSEYVTLVQSAVEAIEAAERTDITLLRGNEGSIPEAVRALNIAEEGGADTAPSSADSTGN